MSKRIVISLFEVILLLTGCEGDEDDNRETSACSADSPCRDSAKVCVNRQCIDRCTRDSCPALQFCKADGVCAGRKIEGQTCSDTEPCISNLICGDGVCSAQNTPAAGPCDEDADCPNDGLCMNDVCVSRCTATSCRNGRICASTGLCVEGAKAGEACDAGKPCASHLSCLAGVCKEKPCSDVNPCVGADAYCSGGVCVAKCDDETNPCAGRHVCGDEGRCIEPCYAGVCPEGTVCGSPKRVCVPGECSWYDDCPDHAQLCDLTTNRCVDKCAKGTCGDGKVCDDDRRCIAGECSAADPCADNTKVCDTESHLCVDKCSDNASCGDGMLCYGDGLCRGECSAGSCGEGTVCGPDGICIAGECSAVDSCDISYKVCDNYRCVDKCKKTGDCGAGRFCNTSSGLCRDACTAASCGEGMVCGEQGYCVSGECSAVTPCDAGRVCSASHQCVTETFDTNECYFYADCTDKCDCDAACSAENFDISDESKIAAAIESCKTACTGTCEACTGRNKPCGDAKQCNAMNTCIDKKDKKGLGESCALNKECDDDLTCVISSVTKKGVCKSKAYAEDLGSCVEGTFTDHCVGNIIVECIDNQIQVQDCKTFYQDLTAATLANFYGDDFTCVARPNSTYVMCAKSCDKTQIGDDWYVCGWDTDDPDIDFSDHYVCQYNDDGRAAFFPIDSRYCTPSCDAGTGKCE